MSKLDNGEQSRLNILASSAPAAEKKAASARVKKPKKGSGLAAPDKVEKDAMLAAYHGDNVEIEEGAAEDNMDPSRPFLVLEKMDLAKMREWGHLRSEWLAKSKQNDIIITDPTPEWVRDAFFDISPRLRTILEEDSVECFLRLFRSKDKEGMIWDYTITSQTLTYMVTHDALRCAKVVLEGKEPVLNSLHANPNCINPFGYFPLHEAAEKFSVDMIKLLFCHGASANVRTVGDEVVEDLLPLHVAVENACLHKYLEDNLLPTQDPKDYMYNLIHLLCLPEMKIFLDTIRLLAKETDNLVDELWNYIKRKKLHHTTILLLAAHEHIRGDISSRNGKQNGFAIIMNRIVEQLSSKNKKGENGSTRKQLEESMALGEAFKLLNIISEAGEDLNKYIQAHSEVTHVEVLEHVSSILKDHGFCPTGQSIDVGNLHPYACKRLYRDLDGKGATKAISEMSHGAGDKAETPRGWDPEYSRRMFFPYWRSVLVAKCPVKVYPSYAPVVLESEFDPEEPWNSRSSSMVNGSSPKPNHNFGWLGRLHQPMRPFGTAAFAVLKKVLRK